MAHVVIIGGGLSGLAAAHRLHETSPSVRVTVLEGSSRVGGIVSTDRSGGFITELGPDSILTEKPWAVDLIKRLGLESQLIRTETRPRGAYVVCRGRLEPVPEGFSLLAPTKAAPLLRSPILSWGGKLRAAADLILPRRTESSEESLASFVTRRFGREVLERLAQPLVGGIYGADPAALSLEATMPRFVAAEREHRSVILGLRRRAGHMPVTGARYGLFVTLAGGMQVLTDTLAAQSHAEIRLNASVTRIAQHGTGWTLEGEDRTSMRCDGVVVALPAWRSAELLEEVDRDLATDLRRIAHGSAGIVSLAWNRSEVPHPLDAFGFVVPDIEGRSILACTWSSEKYSGRAPEGRVLLRVFFGERTAGALLRGDDATLVAAARSELRDLMGIDAAPHFVRVTRHDRGLPQYHLGHRSLVDRIESTTRRHAGLALVGSAYRGVGMPDVIHYAERAAERLSSELGSRSPSSATTSPATR